LQNIGKKNGVKKMTLIEVAQIFQEVLCALSSTSSLEEMDKILGKLKLKFGY
jgi:hypothetical protein